MGDFESSSNVINVSGNYIATDTTLVSDFSSGIRLMPETPKPLSDREWLDAEVEEVCARAV